MAADDADNKKKRGKSTGSIDAFWADYPRLHMAKQVLDGLIELAFLVLSAMAENNDKGKVCEDT